MQRAAPTQATMFSVRVSDYLLAKENRFISATFSEGTSCDVIIRHLQDNEQDCAIISDIHDRICGIITESDIVRRITFLVGGETLASEVMSVDVRSVEVSDCLYSAIASMQKHRLRHMLVIDGEGRPIGLIRLGEAMDFCTSGMFQRLQWMYSDARNLSDLGVMKKKQVDLAEQLIREYVPVPHIQVVISQINKEINRSVVEIALREMKDEGWVKPDVSFAILMMGSGGREENFLYPDQDNGIIIDDYADDLHDEIDAWFRVLSEKINIYLDEVGFPLCLGHVMARNPMWRKTISQWEKQTEIWIVRKLPFAISYSDIFFDFGHLYGEHDLIARLRLHVNGLLKSNPAFVRMLFQDNQFLNSLPLGWFDRLKGGYKGEINMKHHVIMPAVQILRHLSLKYGISETSSAKRLVELHEKGFFNETSVVEIIEAFDVTTKILLSSQIEQYREGLEVTNYVRLSSLTARQKRDLRQSLLTIRSMIHKATIEFTGHVL